MISLVKKLTLRSLMISPTRVVGLALRMKMPYSNQLVATHSLKQRINLSKNLQTKNLSVDQMDY